MYDFLKNFKLSEFDSPDDIGSGEIMKEQFLRRLQTAREISGVSYDITSGVRTPFWNRKVGGARDSSHITGWAVDIRVTSSRNRYLILNGLIEAGFTRIGIGENFIHVDADPNKIEEVIWHYYKPKLTTMIKAMFFGYDNVDDWDV